MGSRSGIIGDEAEARCAQYLRERGYEIVAMKYRRRVGEIDIIAVEKTRRGLFGLAGSEGYIVFVEVKCRSRTDFGEPREAVTYSKRRKLRLTAELYLSEHETELQPRFDVMEVFVESGGSMRINHIKDAFY